MKRKLADRPDWQRVTEKSYVQMSRESDDFSGYLSLITLQKVREPGFIAVAGRQICIADDHFTWLQHFPNNGSFALTTMFDAAGEVVQWYIDICDGFGMDERGIPWYDDLYLDIVILPTGEIQVLDADELEEAWREGLIDIGQFDKAWNEVNRLLAEIQRGDFHLPSLSKAHREMLRKSGRIFER